MEQEAFIHLVHRLRYEGEELHTVEIREEEFATLTKEQAEEIVALYGANAMITLPERERIFYEWLRSADPTVWNDLWGGDDIPYQVSLSFLPDLLPNRRGFAICDLVEQQNFYFTVDDIQGEDGSAFLDAALSIVKNEGKISMDQAFVVEVWRAPIDQWRFAYLYHQPLDEVKVMVRWLINEDILADPARPKQEESSTMEEE